MALHAYPALLEGDADTGFSVWFPDLDGCVSAGDSASEAALNAQEALALHLEGLMAEGLPVPPASDLGAVKAGTDAPEAARLLVTAYIPDPNPRTDAHRSLAE
jgi:predicted RNase H-like HicB family nuclease